MRNELSSRALACGLGLALMMVSAGCDDRVDQRRVILFNGEGNNLNAYDGETLTKQTVIRNRAQDPNGLDLNAQICFDPRGNRQFIGGEDTNQPNPPQGWGIFQLEGEEVGSLRATRIAKLTPTYQGSLDNAENYGCGFLSDGRVVTTDVGSQAAGPSDGQLIIWFPPFGLEGNRYCKLDIAIGTAGGVYIDEDDRIYLTSARNEAGVYRYTGPFPSGDTPAQGCDSRDRTGAPLATGVRKELFVKNSPTIPTPNAIVASGRGTFYISSVLNGVIAEYGMDGSLIRRIVEPPAGEVLGPEPFSTGSPLGLGVDSGGTVYYADIGIVLDSSGIGPGNRTGTVRRIRFKNGSPLPPETIDSGLSFPDGIGILER